MGRALTLAAAAILTLTPLAASADIFRWVGEDNVINFGDQPPPGVDAKLIKTTDLPKDSRPRTGTVNNHQQISDYLKRIEQQKLRPKNNNSSNGSNNANATDKQSSPDSPNQADKDASHKRSEKSQRLRKRTDQLKQYADRNTPQGRADLKKTQKQRIQEAKQQQRQRLNSKLANGTSN